MNIGASTEIARPVSVVWDWYAVRHVENHPRWDPTIKLDLATPGPLAVGSVINRTVTRFGNVTEGTMKVLEFDPERRFRVETHDGPMTIYGEVTFQALGDGATRLTLGGEFPDLDPEVADQVGPMMEQSAATIKELIEAET